ncbi:unnamed protein product [Ambrosiozyma monospora]|uniref:Unnamed protein product n=1 Tax=Ambrosiozyma monospora TaxID=43982 RepID=A0A9W7DG40_AMBMO|nr:unnamed protein product [Ambrosiozyma monospora]
MSLMINNFVGPGWDYQHVPLEYLQVETPTFFYQEVLKEFKELMFSLPLELRLKVFEYLFEDLSTRSLSFLIENDPEMDSMLTRIIARSDILITNEGIKLGSNYEPGFTDRTNILSKFYDTTLYIKLSQFIMNNNIDLQVGLISELCVFPQNYLQLDLCNFVERSKAGLSLSIVGFREMIEFGKLQWLPRLVSLTLNYHTVIEENVIDQLTNLRELTMHSTSMNKTWDQSSNLYKLNPKRAMSLFIKVYLNSCYSALIDISYQGLDKPEATIFSNVSITNISPEFALACGIDDLPVHYIPRVRNVTHYHLSLDVVESFTDCLKLNAGTWTTMTIEGSAKNMVLDLKCSKSLKKLVMKKAYILEENIKHLPSSLEELELVDCYGASSFNISESLPETIKLSIKNSPENGITNP